jgi:hypothetical protein
MKIHICIPKHGKDISDVFYFFPFIIIHLPRVFFRIPDDNKTMPLGSLSNLCAYFWFLLWSHPGKWWRKRTHSINSCCKMSLKKWSQAQALNACRRKRRVLCRISCKHWGRQWKFILLEGGRECQEERLLRYRHYRKTDLSLIPVFFGSVLMWSLVPGLTAIIPHGIPWPPILFARWKNNSVLKITHHRQLYFWSTKHYHNSLKPQATTGNACFANSANLLAKTPTLLAKAFPTRFPSSSLAF